MIMKINKAGKVVWQKKLTIANGYGFFNNIASTSDGGFILAGFSVIADGEIPLYQLMVVRLTSNGNIIFIKQYELNDLLSSGGEYITQTTDGGFAVTSIISQGLSVHRLNPTGDILWSKLYKRTDNNGATSESIVRGIMEDNNKLIITGSSVIEGQQGAGYLLSLNSVDGTVLPSYIYQDETAGFTTTFQSVKKIGGNYFTYTDRHGSYNAVVKLNQNGDVLVSKYFTDGGIPGINMTVTSDGGLIFLSTSAGETSSAIAYKITNQLQVDWVKSFTYTNAFIFGGSISQLSGGNYFIAATYNDASSGSMSLDQILGIKTDNNGNSCSSANFQSSFLNYQLSKETAIWNSQNGFNTVFNGPITFTDIRSKVKTLCKTNSGDDDDDDDDDCDNY
jgi:hypothetical protein